MKLVIKPPVLPNMTTIPEAIAFLNDGPKEPLNQG